jgi:hypothetical protein
MNGLPQSNHFTVTFLVLSKSFDGGAFSFDDDMGFDGGAFSFDDDAFDLDDEACPSLEVPLLPPTVTAATP